MLEGKIDNNNQRTWKYGIPTTFIRYYFPLFHFSTFRHCIQNRKAMSNTILYSDTPEHFYEQLREFIRHSIQQELSAVKKVDEEIEYIKKTEVCKMLRVSKPTIDSHVERGYYRKYCIGSRVFYNKREILSYLAIGIRTI